MSDKDQIALMHEMVMWLRFMGIGKAKSVLTTTLNNEKKIIIYDLSDGKNTSTYISNQVGLGQTRITDLWKEWLMIGIGESISASGGGRFKKLFDLKMFGIKIPNIKSLEDGTINE